MLLLQGFASGDLERDATAVRMFTDAGVELILSQARFRWSLHAFTLPASTEHLLSDNIQLLQGAALVLVHTS